MSFIDKLFCLSLILNGTELFSFLAPQFNVNIGYISTFLLAFNLLYLVIRIRQVLDLLRSKYLVAWIILLLVWPLLTVIYAPHIDYRQVGLQFYYSSLFLGTICFGRTAGQNAIYRMIGISLFLTLFGMILSMTSPQYFEAVAILADARIPGEETMGRPTGFFMQPNRLATCLNMMFIVWFGLWRKRTLPKEMAVVLLLIVIQIVTGSRAGLLVGLGIALLVTFYRSPHNASRNRTVFAVITISLGLLLGMAGLRFFLDNFVPAGYFREGGLFDRMDSITSFRLSSEERITDDTSVWRRLAAQQYYLGQIGERPIQGYGFGARYIHLESGRFWLSPHSDAITKAFEHGIFYPIALVVMLFLLLKRKMRKHIEDILGTNTVLQFVLSAIVLFVYSSAMESRLFYIVLALFVLFFLDPHCLEIPKQDDGITEPSHSSRVTYNVGQ